jgi:hypothetical protein
MMVPASASIPPKKSHSSLFVPAALALVGVVYVVSLFLLPRAGLWTLDNAVKYLQVQGLDTSGLRSSALPWAGARIATPEQCSPVPVPFGLVENGQLHGIYSPFFALTSVLPFKLFGFRGLVLLPLFATLLMLVGLVRLAKSLGLGDRGQAWAVVLAGLATPTWFYAVMFWEHSLAVCFVVWSLVAVAGFARTGATRSLVLGAIAGAFAVYFRDDLYVALPFLAGFALLARPSSRRERLRVLTIFATVAILALCPLWAINAHYTGHVLGFHLTVPIGALSGLREFIELRPIIFHHLFFALHASLPTALILAIPILVLFIVNPRATASWSRWALPLAVTWAALPLLIAFWGLSQGESLVSQLKSTNGLFFASPLLALGLFRTAAEGEPKVGGADRLAMLLARFVLACTVGYALIAPQRSSASGIHWGNRFLLMTYPLLALLAVRTLAAAYRSHVARRGLGSLVVAMVISLSFSAQVYSINLALRTERFFDRLNAAVETETQSVVLTSTWWIPLLLYRSFSTRSIFLTSDHSCWQTLEPQLKSAGVEHVLDIQSLDDQDRTLAGASTIKDDGLDFYDVTLQRQVLGDFFWRPQRVRLF